MESPQWGKMYNHQPRFDTDEQWGLDGHRRQAYRFSIWQSWPVYRQQVPLGRTALIEAAAAKWAVDASPA